MTELCNVNPEDVATVRSNELLARLENDDLQDKPEDQWSCERSSDILAY